MLRLLTPRPALRGGRRGFTNLFFVATFLGAVGTVSLSASSFLPCPAAPGSKSAATNGGSAGYGRIVGAQEQDEEEMRAVAKGQRARLTKAGGWIEIEERKPRRS